MSIFGSTDTLFQTSGDGSSGAALFILGEDLCDICSLTFTSGVTPMVVYMTSTAASCFPHMCVSAEVGCWTQIGDLPLITLSSQMHYTNHSTTATGT